MYGVSVLVRKHYGCEREAVRVCRALLRGWPLAGFSKPGYVERDGSVLRMFWHDAVSDRLDYDYSDLFRALTGLIEPPMHGAVYCRVPAACGCYRIESKRLVLLYDLDDAEGPGLGVYVADAYTLSPTQLLDLVTQADADGVFSEARPPCDNAWLSGECDMAEGGWGAPVAARAE